MNQKVTLAVLLTALLAAGAYYQFTNFAENNSNVNALDMTCGFTDDFTNFLKNNGKHSPIQDTPHGTSTGQTSNALPSEARQLLRKKL